MPTTDFRMKVSACKATPSLNDHRQICAETRAPAEAELSENRKNWTIEKILAAHEAGASAQSADQAHQWKLLLTPLNVRGFERWTDLNLALTPFCMGASGPRNPKTGQYIVEIRMLDGQSVAHQVAQVQAGIDVMLPYLKPYRGCYEFRIACKEVNTRDKNWLMLEKSGKARITSALRPEAPFDNLHSALIYISERKTVPIAAVDQKLGTIRRRNGW